MRRVRRALHDEPEAALERVEHLTPAGNPTRSTKTAMASTDSGVLFAGLQTTVQPAASAGPILRPSMAPGKFHRVMRTITPTGCFRTALHLSAEGLRNHVTVEPLRLLGEPLDEARSFPYEHR